MTTQKSYFHIQSVRIISGVLFIIVFLTGFLTTSSDSNAQSFPLKDSFSVYGQLRPSLTHIDSRNNRGVETSLTQYQIRARMNVDYSFSSQVKLQTRLVMKLSTETNAMEFWTHPYAPSSGGLAAGQTTFDVFNIAWRPSTKLYIEIGRMQHAFQLRGLIPKSFDRYHSQNLASTWSDGLWFRWSAFKHWDVHTIFQYNHPNGSGSAFTGPISFKNDAARLSYFIALENTDTGGFWSQRGISATLIPQSIVINGEDKNYFLFSGRVGVNLPLELSWMRVNIGTELAYAPNSPDYTQFNLEPDTPRASGSIGWQASLNFQRIFEKNALSILYGYAEPGMLIAPSYRNNIDTWEIRYQYRFTSTISTEIRYRIRHQQYKPVNADVLRLDRDFYARLTIRI